MKSFTCHNGMKKGEYEIPELLDVCQFRVNSTDDCVDKVHGHLLCFYPNVRFLWNLKKLFQYSKLYNIPYTVEK